MDALPEALSHSVGGLGSRHPEIKGLSQGDDAVLSPRQFGDVLRCAHTPARRVESAKRDNNSVSVA